MHNLNKYFISAISITLLGASTNPVQAADKELLDMLLSNGAITLEQYDTLVAKQELEKADLAVVKVGNGRGLNISSGDGRYEVEIGGRLHMDWVEHDYDVRIGQEPVNGSQIRRGRVEFNGVFDQHWLWAAEMDFAKNRVDLKDFKLGYETEAGTTFFFGNQKQPYSHSLEMSSNDEPFIERSIDNALNAAFTDRALGFRTDVSGEKWFVAAGVFGDTVNAGGRGNEGWGSSGRVVAAPILNKDAVVHLGLRYAYREIGEASSTLSIKDKTSDFSDLSIVNTGALTTAKSATLFGPEFAIAFGPLYVFGEYSDASIERSGADTLDFSSWHVAAAWSLTGESRVDGYSISAGEFKGLPPARPFAPGRAPGGVELAVKYAAINLNDGAFVGGEEETLALGVNWYLNTNVRLMLDWTHILNTDESSTIREFAPDMNIFSFRTQYNY